MINQNILGGYRDNWRPPWSMPEYQRPEFQLPPWFRPEFQSPWDRPEPMGYGRPAEPRGLGYGNSQFQGQRPEMPMGYGRPEQSRGFGYGRPEQSRGLGNMTEQPRLTGLNRAMEVANPNAHDALRAAMERQQSRGTQPMGYNPPPGGTLSPPRPEISRETPNSYGKGMANQQRSGW